MGDKEFKLPMDIMAIQKCLPHRHPMLLVDRIIELEPHCLVKGIKCISIADPILQGHFPDFPVFPGVLIVEGVAQTAGVLGYVSLPDGFDKCLLTEITKTRFRKQVIPGDVLTYEIKVKRARAPFFWFSAEATVDGEVAAQIELSALMK